MVSFHDNPEKYNSAAMLLELDKEVLAFIIVLFISLLPKFSLS